ncbi:endolytic transglycosylase MltG [Candidatus Peregrinibacteria bacterium CG10_big_fil_rev_8_21_14_0_10_42_8]|nr:MAG: endolytic transglycosylase MltG [Candidatus Peregrinibacteria bacterium CG10_big_fil_rev_8_21_14_0_10_42_8]
MKKLFLYIIVISVAFAFWYMHATSAISSDSNERKKVIIEPGWSTIQIAEHLADKGFIRSPLGFRLYVRSQKLDGSLQAGVFLLQKSQTVSEIVEVLQTGKAEEEIVTIPEGFTVLDIDNLLTSMGLIKKGEAVRCSQECDFESYDFLPDNITGLAQRGGRLEGYLFPDTYYVQEESFVVKFFLERMLNAFRSTVLEGQADAIAASGRDLSELITMASLIEEETRKEEERDVVSGILWKRYDDGRGLGVDATVRYILNKQTEAITHSDLNSNSAYNTRKFKGLPPGPIANPGLPSIIAAAKPKSSPYWYYLHGNDGKIYYAVTNEEHNTNRYFQIGSGSED